MCDKHIWLSVLKRPASTTFTRVQRTTCCLVLIYTSMMASLMFYGQKAKSSRVIEIGPISIATQQISVGIMSGIIIAPVNILMMCIFRAARPRPEPSSSACTCCGKKRVRIEGIQRRSKQDTTSGYSGEDALLPWWFIYVGYALSLLVCAIAFFFANKFAQTLGYRKSTEWIRAFLIGICQSAFVQEPAKVSAGS